MNAAAGRTTVTKQYDVGKVAMNLLAKNLASQLTPSPADEQLFGLDSGTPTAIASLSRGFIVAIKAMSLGLTSMMVQTGIRNDPHGLFAGGDGDAARVGKALGAMYNGIYQFAKSKQDPGCSSKTLADRMVLAVCGDTYKGPFERSGEAGWTDNTPDNSNLLYVMGNGYLKTGWFGEVSRNGARGWDPATGETSGAFAGRAESLGESAAAAFLYAVSRGDMRRVRDFYSGTPIDGVVNLNVTG